MKLNRTTRASIHVVTDATSRMDVKSKELAVKKTWFHGLAITLGIVSIPSVATAQYSISNTNGSNGNGLSGSAYAAQPRNNVVGLQNYLNPVPTQTRLTGYAQNGAVGSGIPQNGHIHIPAQTPAVDSQVLNSQYQSVPQGYAAPEGLQYEQAPQTIPPATAPGYGNPYAGSVTPYGAPATPAAPTPSPMGSVPMSTMPSTGAAPCATGNCGGSAVGYYDDYQGSCGVPSVACGPSITSPNRWIFGANALLFDRFDDQYVRLTSDSNMPTNSYLSTRDAQMSTSGGFQVSAGRYFCDGRYAVIGSYWGIFSNPNTVTLTAPAGGNLRTNLPFTLRGPGAGSVPYGITMPAQNVYDWYDGAWAHRLVRDQEFHNVEVNFFSFALGGGARQPYAQPCGDVCGSPCGTSACGVSSCGSPCTGGPTGPCAPWYGAQCSKLRLNLFGGIRWFRFKDSLEYATSETDAVFGNNADDFYYRNGVTNDLVGFQLGSQATWCTGTRLNLFAGTSFGIFGNHMTANTFAGTNTAAATIVSTNAFNGNAYDYSSSLTDVSFLGEGNVGCGIRICRGWTGNIGYRVVGVSGVATAVGQIPRDFSLANDATKINNYNSLILHGLTLGANYNF